MYRSIFCEKLIVKFLLSWFCERVTAHDASQLWDRAGGRLFVRVPAVIFLFFASTVVMLFDKVVKILIVNFAVAFSGFNLTLHFVDLALHLPEVLNLQINDIRFDFLLFNFTTLFILFLFFFSQHQLDFFYFFPLSHLLDFLINCNSIDLELFFQAGQHLGVVFQLIVLLESHHLC